jgi:hypothetical protein
LPESSLPAGAVSAQEQCFTSDLTRGLSGGASVRPKSHILTDRNEGRFLASSESHGKWFGISKVILTMFTSQGRDALITDVPSSVIEVLHLTCPNLVIVLKGSGGSAPM